MRHHLQWAFLAAVVVLAGLVGCGGQREKEPSPEPPDETDTTPMKCEGHEREVMAVAVSPDGRLVVSGSADQTLRFWDAPSGKPIRTVKPIDPRVEGAWVGGLAFAPDGQTLVACPSGPFGQRLECYDPMTGKIAPGHLPMGQGGYGVAFSPDGKSLAVASNEAVRVWGVLKGDKLHEFTFPRRWIGRAWRVAFSPDGQRLAAALEGTGEDRAEGPLVRVWDLATGKEVFTAWEGGKANAVAFSPDGRLLAFGGEHDGAVEVYDWARNERLAHFRADPHGIFCLAFSADGKRVYTGGDPPEVRRWQAATGKPAGSLKGHTDQVADLALSKDGKVLATAGRDRLVLIWHLGPGGR